MSTRERGSSTRRGRAAGLVVALVALALASTVTPAEADTGQVTAAGLAFSPETVTVRMSEGEPEQPKPHAHVDFVMRDEGVEHTVFFDDQSVAGGSSGRLGAGLTYTVEFEGPGTYFYRCEIHPNMTGTVVITPVRTVAEDADEGDEGGSGTSVGILLAVAGLAGATVAAAVLLVRRRRLSGEPGTPGSRPSRPRGS